MATARKICVIRCFTDDGNTVHAYCGRVGHIFGRIDDSFVYHPRDSACDKCTTDRQSRMKFAEAKIEEKLANEVRQG